MGFKEDKEKYLNLSKTQIRKEYECGSYYFTLDDIPTWQEHSKNINLDGSISSEYPKRKSLNTIVSLFDGDITALEIDCIVNAANKFLSGGGGVDGAIHEAAGKQLLAECKSLNGCPTGQAKLTGGYKLPAKYVIQTVGPRGEKPDILKKCYSNSLKLAKKHELKSIAFPCISTGAYGYPNKKAAHIALRTVREFLQDNPKTMKRIIFCPFTDEDMKIYEELMQMYFPV